MSFLNIQLIDKLVIYYFVPLGSEPPIKRLTRNNIEDQLTKSPLNMVSKHEKTRCLRYFDCRWLAGNNELLNTTQLQKGAQLLSVTDSII